MKTIHIIIMAIITTACCQQKNINNKNNKKVNLEKVNLKTETPPVKDIKEVKETNNN